MLLDTYAPLKKINKYKLKFNSKPWITLGSLTKVKYTLTILQIYWKYTSKIHLKYISSILEAYTSNILQEYLVNRGN